MRNKVLKCLAIMLVVIFILSICSISCASSITAANIKESIKKMSTNEIFIKGSDNSSTTMNGGTDESDIITDSGIGGKLDGVEYILFNYSVEGNNCILTANIDEFYKLLKIDPSKISKEELETNSSMIALLTYMYMENIFIAASDAVGQDLSLAYTYFIQQTSNIFASEKININSNNDIFSIIMNVNDNNKLETATIRINLDNLATLNDSKIDTSKTTYKVFLGQLPDSEREDIGKEYKLDNIDYKAYTGSEIKPSVKLLDKAYGFEAYLNKGSDFKVSYSNNINPGKAKVTVTGIRYYKGTLTKKFYIVPKKVNGVTNKTQGKKDITVKWDKAVGATGYELEKYDTSKKKYVKVTSKEIKTNSFKVTGLKPATTYKFRVRAYITIDGKKRYGSYSSTTKLTTKSTTPNISKVTPEKKKFTVKYNKVTGADGYQIQYSTDKNFKNTNKTKTSKTSKTVSNLKSKKKYYVRVRTYREINGKKIYSSFSKISKVKVK